MTWIEVWLKQRGIMNSPYVKKLGEFWYKNRQLTIWSVDAPTIRSNPRQYPGGIEFFAGHHAVYSWIPAGQIWVDSDFRRSEKEYIVFDHELPEEYKMTVMKMLYEPAHAQSNLQETAARVHGVPSGRLKE